MSNRVASGILLLPPDRADPSWKVLEVDADVFDSISLSGDGLSPEDVLRYNSAPAALGAAYDTLTLITEGRVPAMHEHVQESVREFVQLLEDRGYDREHALRLLTQMVDRMGDRSPVQTERTGQRPTRRAS
jgi:hypothetical protein